VRGLDWAPDGSRVVVADSRARIYLFNNNLTTQITKEPYLGKPYQENIKTNDQKKISPFV
jgi:hypothetical protein